MKIIFFLFLLASSTIFSQNMASADINGNFKIILLPKKPTSISVETSSNFSKIIPIKKNTKLKGMSLDISNISNKNLSYKLINKNESITTIDKMNLWKDLNSEDSSNILYSTHEKLIPSNSDNLEHFKAISKINADNLIIDFEGQIHSQGTYSALGTVFFKISDETY